MNQLLSMEALYLVLDWADIAKILGAVCSWGISSAVSEPVEVSLRFWINSLLWKWLQETLSKSSLSWDDGSSLLSIKLILLCGYYYMILDVVMCSYLWKVVKAVNLIIPGDFTIKELLINLFDHILIFHQSLLSLEFLFRIISWLHMKLLLKLLFIQIVQRIKIH